MAALLRSGAPRTLFRSLHASSTPATRFTSSPLTLQLRSQFQTLSHRPHAATPKTLSLVRYYADRKPIDTIDEKQEDSLHDKTLRPTPDTVSSSSTTSSELFSENPRSGHGQDEDPKMMAGINADLQTIRDTFSLEDVPRRAYYMGMAGVVPYALTSASTVFCAFEINRAASTGSGLLLNEKTAELLLHIIEPLQVGYGAVIISFLGAIHWGLEWAKYHGEKGYPRYMIGVVSTAAAWPTLLLPVEYALISQFLIFNFLYYADARACTRGWTPGWYNVYRFVLTFIVGASIVMSLIGRGQIADQIGRLPGPADRIRELQEWREDHMETEEEARRRMLATKDEDDDDE